MHLFLSRYDRPRDFLWQLRPIVGKRASAINTAQNLAVSAMKCLYLVTRSLERTGTGQTSWQTSSVHSNP